MDETKKIWRDVLLSELARTGLTQREAEELGGIPRNSISRWINLRSGITRNNQEKLAKAFGRTPEDLRSVFAEFEKGRQQAAARPAPGARHSNNLMMLEADMLEADINALAKQHRSVMASHREDIEEQLLRIESRIRVFLEHYQNYSAMAGKRPSK